VKTSTAGWVVALILDLMLWAIFVCVVYFDATIMLLPYAAQRMGVAAKAKITCVCKWEDKKVHYSLVVLYKDQQGTSRKACIPVWEEIYRNHKKGQWVPIHYLKAFPDYPALDEKKEEDLVLVLGTVPAFGLFIYLIVITISTFKQRETMPDPRRS
jgi:hypothetical protein